MRKRGFIPKERMGVSGWEITKRETYGVQRILAKPTKGILAEDRPR